MAVDGSMPCVKVDLFPIAVWSGPSHSEAGPSHSAASIEFYIIVEIQPSASHLARSRIDLLPYSRTDWRKCWKG